ncbi:hypothetical protein ACIBG5_35155 [Kribbella sp. NPDC050241]|uniref:hypothetical protein n=1 Tax=Kribbella sp. NPDC050241 TaxID=3364115 RepID=UPI003793AC30
MRLWWHDPFRMFQTNLREIDAGLDVEKVLDYLEEFGANTWLLSVGGILSNYPTDLDFQTRNPHLAERPSGDLVGDAVKAAARRGIRVMGRMDFSKIDHRRAEAHPDWCFVGPQGARQVYNGLTSVCPSGDYYQVKLFEVLDEVLDRYPLDGFFCNWMSFNEVDYSRVYHGVCHCVSCHERYDGPLPDGRDSPGYEDWQLFSATVLADLTQRIRDHLAARRPEAPLVLGDQADIVFHEANNAVGRRLWHHRTSEAVSAAKTYRPTVPVLTNSVGFVDMPYRMASEDPHHFAQYLLQAIARGANPSTYIMGTPSDNPYACLQVAGELTRFHRDHQDVYRDLVPAAETLLVRPKEGSTPDFQGLYLSLLQRHVPFDVLPEKRLLDVDLRRYRVIVLPDLGVVELGEYDGGIVATGATEVERLPVRRLASYETEAATRGLHLQGWGACGRGLSRGRGRTGCRDGLAGAVQSAVRAAGEVSWAGAARASGGRQAWQHGAVPVDYRAFVPGGRAGCAPGPLCRRGDRDRRAVNGDGPAGADRDRARPVRGRDGRASAEQIGGYRPAVRSARPRRSGAATAAGRCAGSRSAAVR